MRPFESPRAQKFRDLVNKEETGAFETLWLETLEEAPDDVPSFLAGADALLSRGNAGRASLYLSMLPSPLLERKLFSQALEVLRKLVEINAREGDLRGQLLTVYKELYGSRPHFAKYLERSGLETTDQLAEAVKSLDTFLSFEVGSYVFHPAGWGCGRVVEVDSDEATIVIDFATKPSHGISMEMARKVTESIEPNDLRALKLDREEELDRLLKEDPAEVIRAALRVRNGTAQLREVRNRITDGVITVKAWSKWWQKARTQIKRCTDITMGPGTNPTLELKELGGSLSVGGGLSESYLRDLRLVAEDKKRIKYFRDLLRESDVEGANKADAITVIAGALLGPDGHAIDMDPGPRISLAFLLEEARRQFPSANFPATLTPADLVKDKETVLTAFPEIPIPSHRVSILKLLQGAVDDWPVVFEDVILRGEPETADSALEGLIAHGHTELAMKTLRTVIERYREFPQAFAWYVKIAQSKSKLPKTMPRISRPALLEKTLILHNFLESPGGNDEEMTARRKIARSIMTFLQLRDFGFIKAAFLDADITEGLNLATIIKRNRSLSREIRDKVMAVMYRTRPELAKQPASGSAEQETSDAFDPSGAIYITSASLLRRRKEYELLVNDRIPENATEIGRAASYGDLSENAEWSAAIEKQGQLTTLSQQWGAELQRARIIDESVRTEGLVSLGSRVKVRTPGGDEVFYTVLGPWDVDMHRNYISYLSPMGMALLNKQVGEFADVEVSSGVVRYEILEMEEGLADAEKVLSEKPLDI